VREQGEVCDGNDLGGLSSCTDVGYQSGALSCKADCSGLDVTDCQAAPSVCPNNIREESEVCDGSDLGGLSSCTDLGYQSGVLSCNADCLSFNATSCVGTPALCTNGVRETGEVCDGSDLGGLSSCTDLGYQSGALSCNADCLGFNVTACVGTPALCTNGVRETGEVCDGSDLGGLSSCTDLGYQSGVLSCNADCLDFNVTACVGTPSVCNNDLRETGEVCDGSDLGGVSACAALGYTSGTLGCLNTCQAYDVSNCQGPQWGCNGFPVVDTHVHVIPLPGGGHDEDYIDNLVSAALDAGVTKLLLGLHAKHTHLVTAGLPTYSTEHDDWVMGAHSQYPDVIIPLLAGFDPADANAPTYVQQQLATGNWKGIGELDLRNSPKQTTTAANSPIMMQIYALAATYDVPVLMHHQTDYGTDSASGEAELRDAFSQNPNTNFITAHSCMLNLLAEYSNVYCEYEFPNSEIPAEYGDRVIFGSDVQAPDLTVSVPETPPATGMVSYSYAQVFENLCAKAALFSMNEQDLMSQSTAVRLFHLDE
jgi:hypothetical protein